MQDLVPMHIFEPIDKNIVVIIIQAAVIPQLIQLAPFTLVEKIRDSFHIQDLYYAVITVCNRFTNSPTYIAFPPQTSTIS